MTTRQLPYTAGQMERVTRATGPLPHELPAVVGFQQFARFVSLDPDENRQRFYTLTWQPLLWGGGALVRTWGRVGTRGPQQDRRLPRPRQRSAAGRAADSPAPSPPLPAHRLGLTRPPPARAWHRTTLKQLP